MPKLIKGDVKLVPQPPAAAGLDRFALYDHERSNDRLQGSMDDLWTKLDELGGWLKELCDQLEVVRKALETDKLKEALRRFLSA